MGAVTRLRRRFLGPAPASSLGVLRIVCVARGLDQVPRYVEAMSAASELPQALRPPPGDLPVPWPAPPGTQAILVAAVWASGAAALVGLGTRFSLAAFTALLAYLAAGNESLGRIDHSILFVLFALPALVLSPGADALSLDRRIRRRRTGDGGPTLVPRWGLATVLLLLSALYAASAVAKLRFSGGRWGDGETLGRYLAGMTSDPNRQLLGALDVARPADLWRDGVGLAHHLYLCRSGDAGRWIAARPALTSAMSVAVLAAEAAIPFFLVSRRRRNAGIAAAIAFHASCGALMGLPFWNAHAVLLSLLDVRRLGRRLAGEVASARAIVLFDGVCGLCDRTVGALLRAEPHGRFRYAALQSSAGTRLLAAHGFPAGWTTSIVVIADGRALVRSDAALALAARLDGAWRLLCVLRCVPRPLRDLAYDAVAAVRYRVFGRRAECRVPTTEERSRFLGDDDAPARPQLRK